MTADIVQRIEFPPALFTRELAAYYLSMSLRDIDMLRHLGHITPMGDGKRIRFTKKDLDDYVANLAERSR